MRLRRGYWWIPLLAVLGILFAILHFLVRSLPSGEALLAPLPEEAAKAPVAAAPAPAPAFVPTASPSAAPVSPAGLSHTSLTPDEITNIRSEMKISLAALYGGQKSFFSEFKRYTTDFEALGYYPEGSALRTKVGFIAPYYPRDGKVPDENPTTLSTEELRRSSRNGSSQLFGFAQGVEGLNIADAAKFCKRGCTAGADFFEVVVVSNLDDDPELEVWTVNEKKELIQVNDDRLH